MTSVANPLITMSDQEQTLSTLSPHLLLRPGCHVGLGLWSQQPQPRRGVSRQGVSREGYRMRSSRGSAELIMGFTLCSVVSFWAAPPGWMMETMMMPTITATKVVHR